MNNENRCDKYEAYFVFQDEKKFLEHLQSCDDCKKEHEKYMKVSELVKEVAPVYLSKRQKAKISTIKRLACCFIAFIGLTAFTGYKMYDDYMLQSYSQDYDSCIGAMGLPTDDYGFLDL